MIKTLRKLGIDSIFLKHIKNIYQNPIANIILNSERLNYFPLKIRNQARMTHLICHIQHSTGRSRQHNEGRKGYNMHTKQKERNKTISFLKMK